MIDPERIQNYLNLIQQLLNCPNGEEMELLAAHAELVDMGLVEVMQQVADQIEGERETTAQWLRQFAAGLSRMLEDAAAEATHPTGTERELLQQLLTAEMEGGEAAVRAVLTANLHGLTLEFARVLVEVTHQIIAAHPEAAEMMVALVENISIRIQEFPLGNIANNQEIAIAGYGAVLHHRPPQTELWAQTQNNLGAAYGNRIRGEKAENVEKAIAAYTAALEVYTPEAFPVQWAMTQNNLGNAYSDRIRGEKAENVEKAIEAYTAALEVYTPEAFPVQWATTQNNLGAAYRNRIRGEKAENVEKAIAAYTAALEVYKPHLLPLECLTTANNLGNLAMERGNWQLAIHACELAMTAVEKSRSWATTDDSRQDILNQAVGVYENAIQAYINIGNIGKALETAERLRARRLAELFASQPADPTRDPDFAADLQEYDLLHQRINQLRPAVAVAAGSKRATPDDPQTEELATLEAEAHRLWQRIRQHDPIIAGQLEVAPLSLAQIQTLVPNPATALLSFYTTDDDTHIFVLCHQQPPQLVTCPGQGWETLQKWIEKNWLIPYRKNFDTWHGQMPAFLAELSRRLHLDEWIPQHLAGVEELILVPHLLLHSMPFAALPVSAATSAQLGTGRLKPQRQEPNPPARVADATPPFLCREGGLRELGRGLRVNPAPLPTSQTAEPSATMYFGDLFRLRVVPSCQILQYCRERQPLEKSPSLGAGECHSPLRVGMFGEMGIVEDATPTRPLPFTRYECETLARTYGIPTQHRLQGNAATIAAYKQLLGRVRRLHSSHHGSANLDKSLQCALALADGNLTLGQLLSPDWRFPDLEEVFASYCEGNLGKLEIADDWLTLATGFLCAGARSVISTQWSVEDLASALFALLYYKSRNEGYRPCDAVGQAQRQLRQLSGADLKPYRPEVEAFLQQQFGGDSEAYRQAVARFLGCCTDEGAPFAHPYYWAGFVAQGL